MLGYKTVGRINTGLQGDSQLVGPSPDLCVCPFCFSSVFLRVLFVLYLELYVVARPPLQLLRFVFFVRFWEGGSDYCQYVDVVHVFLLVGSTQIIRSVRGKNVLRESRAGRRLFGCVLSVLREYHRLYR